MTITKETINQVTFENEDARLLILDVVSHTSACLYYFDTDVEITVFMALKIRERAYKADEKDGFYSISLLNTKSIPFRKRRSRSAQLHVLRTEPTYMDTANLCL